MTAVSAALAAVALIFSVGTVLLGQYLEGLSKLRGEIQQALADVSQLKSTLETRLETVHAGFKQDALRLAEELQHVVDQTKADFSMRLEGYGLRMSSLLAVDEARISLLDAKVELLNWVSSHAGSPDRFAFHAMLVLELEQLLSRSVAARLRAFGRLQGYLTSADEAVLPSVARYLRACHVLHGGDDNTIRIWCDLFSSAERAAYVDEVCSKADQFL